MNSRPDCAAAAWIMIGIATEADYAATGIVLLFTKAQQAMQDFEYSDTWQLAPGK